jgi:ribosomal protein S18 acetylase RimI-like enzyme
MLEAPIADDVPEILELVARARVFGRADVDCVRELLDDYFHKPDRGGYEFIVHREDGRVLGMACYGPTALTEGTFDLYWLCVAPKAQGKGIGRRLLGEVEDAINRLGARLLVIETSGTPEYRPARAFYLAMGCHRQATIPDFYAPGDDLVIYTKRYDG